MARTLLGTRLMRTATAMVLAASAFLGSACLVMDFGELEEAGGLLGDGGLNHAPSIRYENVSPSNLSPIKLGPDTECSVTLQISTVEDEDSFDDLQVYWVKDYAPDRALPYWLLARQTLEAVGGPRRGPSLLVSKAAQPSLFDGRVHVVTVAITDGHADPGDPMTAALQGKESVLVGWTIDTSGAAGCDGATGGLR